jgi:glycerol-1-phosphate dehydrogenase [NAD(P)+]
MTGASWIEGQTNVLSSRFGRGEADGIGEELGSFIVTTMDVPWNLARERIGGWPVGILIADSMEFDVVDAQIASAPEGDCVVAVGGGRAIDLGKYLAWKRGIRLVTIPTVLSVDAFVTPSAGLRSQHRVEYVGEASPDPLIIDYDLLRTAPVELNIAGVGDLLSIHTATFDWELAHSVGRSEYTFSAEAVASARDILRSVEEAAGEIGVASDSGLRTIVEGYMRVNTLCLPAGHYRVEEGSEHYLFYELEERLQRTFIHGNIVGLGVALMSRLQENRAAWVTDLMRRMGLRFRPSDMELTEEVIVESLLALGDYVRQAKFWYTVLDERPVTRDWAKGAVRELL